MRFAVCVCARARQNKQTSTYEYLFRDSDGLITLKNNLIFFHNRLQLICKTSNITMISIDTKEFSFMRMSTTIAQRFIHGNGAYTKKDIVYPTNI